MNEIIVKCKYLNKIPLQLIEKVQPRELSSQDLAFIQLIDSYASHYKSIEVLIKNNTYSSISIITRVLFEHYIYIKYLLEADTETRAKKFLFHARYERGKIYENIYLDNDRGSEIRKEFNLNYEEIQKFVKETNYMQEKEEFIIEYKKILQNKRNWYNHSGNINNFAKLCEYLNESILYEILYQSWSLDVHVRGNKNFNLKNIDSNNAYLELIEYDTIETDLIIKSVQRLTIDIVRMIYEKYKMKNELALFNINLKYKADDIIKKRK